MDKRYSRHYTMVQIVEQGQLEAAGCNAFSIYNAGNTALTINKILVLLPGDVWEGGDENPDIVDDGIFNIEFNVNPAYTPLSLAPVGGVQGTDGRGLNINGVYDTRAIMIRSHLKQIG